MFALSKTMDRGLSLFSPGDMVLSEMALFPLVSPSRGTDATSGRLFPKHSRVILFSGFVFPAASQD